MAKKGYTKIDNSIFDALLSPDLKDAELKVILFFLRYTIGFKRDTVRASYSYIAQGTGYCVDTVRATCKLLMKKGILERLYPAKGCMSQVWKFSCESIHTLYVSTLTPIYGVESHLLMGVQSHQDIKEDIKEKDIKEKEKEKPSFLSKKMSTEELANKSWEDNDE